MTASFAGRHETRRDGRRCRTLPQKLLGDRLQTGESTSLALTVHAAGPMGWTNATAAHWYPPLLASIFVVTGALWIGTLFSVSWLSGRARWMADGPEIGRLALKLFHRWTFPSFALSLFAAAGWLALAMAPAGRGLAHWTYAVAVLALPLVALHWAVGTRARRLVQGSVEAARGEGIRRLALVLSIGAVIALATFRPALVP